MRGEWSQAEWSVEVPQHSRDRVKHEEVFARDGVEQEVSKLGKWNRVRRSLNNGKVECRAMCCAE